MSVLRITNVSVLSLLAFLYSYAVNAGEVSAKKEQAQTSESANVKEDFKSLKQDAKQDSKDAGNDMKEGFKKIGDAFKKDDKK